MKTTVTTAEHLYSRNNGYDIQVDAGVLRKEGVVTIATKKHGCDICQMSGHHGKGRFNTMNAVCC